jgi:LemA protein
MKKGTITIITVVAVAVVIALMCISAYNSLVGAREQVTKQWSNVESEYQRRNDLIGNLVNTVKGYAAHEKETLEAITNARTKATQITVDAESLSPEKLKEFQEAQGEMSTALGRLISITENYPDLKANQNFLELQAQLEGTEDRIKVARKEYNESAGSYNTKRQKFPVVLVASMLGFGEKPYFEADKGAEKAPEVVF